MYNEELKARFIRSYTKSLSTAQHAIVVFNAFEKSERQWGADLCTRPASDLQPIVDSVVGMRYQSRWMAISILKEYCRWCIASQIPGAQNGIDGVCISGLEKIKKQMVSSPLHLQKYLDAVFDPENEETIDNTYRCFYWMAFAGIEEEDCLTMTCDRVDLSSLTIRYDDTHVRIYREAIPAFQNAINLKNFAYKNSNYVNAKTIRRDRIDGNAVMKGIKAEPKILTLRPILAGKAKKAIDAGRTDLMLTHYRVWLSGLFFRMYEIERAGEDVDFSEDAIRYVDRRIYADANSRRDRKARIEREYKEDYQRWKLAFSV